MRKRMGRPKLPKGESKKVFTLRLSSDDLKTIEAAAKKAGVKVREWARDRLLSGA